MDNRESTVLTWDIPQKLVQNVPHATFPNNFYTFCKQLKFFIMSIQNMHTK